MDAAYVAPRVQPENAGYIKYVRTTGFYPLYDGENDQVDAIGPIRAVRFQRVIPRYRLSASETNDTGLGPAFYESPVYVSSNTPDVRHATPGHATSSPGPRQRPVVPRERGTGTMVDLYA